MVAPVRCPAGPAAALTDIWARDAKPAFVTQSFAKTAGSARCHQESANAPPAFREIAARPKTPGAVKQTMIAMPLKARVYTTAASAPLRLRETNAIIAGALESLV